MLWFESFIQQLFASAGGPSYVIEEGTVKFSCKAKMPDLYFMIQGYWMKVPARDLIKTGGSLCSLRIRPIDAPFNIMGLPAYKDYYINHDQLWNTMSILPYDETLRPRL